MPMFDDPRKELDRLQARLLAEEEAEPEEIGESVSFDEELDDILDLIREDKEEPPRSGPVYRNYANNYGREQVRNFANNYGREPAPEYTEEEADAALYADEYARPKKKQKKEKGIRGLVFLAILETLGILAVAAWWVKFLWL